MPGDPLVHEITLSPPLGGIKEGLDAALDDTLYAPVFAPECRNIRVAGGKRATRHGIALWEAVGGTGQVRWLTDHYTASGQRIRLAAQGDGAAAVLYELLEGTDSDFNTTTGGTGLGGTTEPYFRGVTLNDAVYFVDRAGALRKYQRAPTSGNQVRSVALPTRPSAAPGVKAKTFETLEGWAGGGGTPPYGWTETSEPAFSLEDGSGTLTSPLGGPTVKLDTKTNPNNKPITEHVTGETLPSNTIAAWVWNSNLPSQIVFQYGTVTATDFSVSLDLPVKESWLPWFVRLGGAVTNFKQFNVIENSGAADLYLSKLVLPGYLDGSYRWVYTHYDPALLRESEPSDIGNGGTPLDLSTIGETGFAGTAAAFQKSAALTFSSDSGTDATTTKVRFYRNGGLPALTKSLESGIDIWCLVGEVYDFSSQVDGATLAGATTMIVDSVTNLAVNDWLVIEKGTVSKEEYARITAINTGSRQLTFSQPLLYAHADNVAVQMAFVDNVPNDQVDASNRIDLERDDPPSAAKWIARSPDGRLWLANYDGKPTGVRVSNRATPTRPTDYEVFPSGVDPLTRHDPLQGWEFEIGGDVNEEAITWLGFFNDRPFAFTRRHLYAINATSQDTWGSYAITKVHNAGCLNGDTVAEVDGVLFWVTEGPRVFRWDGRGSPENVSHQRVNERLKAAPPELWKHWFAVAHTQELGRYYSLYFVPDEAGLTAPTTLTATANGTTQIDLAWTDTSTDEDGFEIQRSTDNVTFAAIGTVAANVTSYADTTVVAATTYYYRVRPFAGAYP